MLMCCVCLPFRVGIPLAFGSRLSHGWRQTQARWHLTHGGSGRGPQARPPQHKLTAEPHLLVRNTGKNLQTHRSLRPLRSRVFSSVTLMGFRTSHLFLSLLSPSASLGPCRPRGVHWCREPKLQGLDESF